LSIKGKTGGNGGKRTKGEKRKCGKRGKGEKGKRREIEFKGNMPPKGKIHIGRVSGN